MKHLAIVLLLTACAPEMAEPEWQIVPFVIPENSTIIPTTSGSGFWVIDRDTSTAWNCYEWNQRGYIECKQLAMKRVTR